MELVEEVLDSIVEIVTVDLTSSNMGMEITSIVGTRAHIAPSSTKTTVQIVKGKALRASVQGSQGAGRHLSKGSSHLAWHPPPILMTSNDRGVHYSIGGSIEWKVHGWMYERMEGEHF